MPNARIKTPRGALAVLLGMWIVMPVTSQKATNTGNRQVEEALLARALVCPTPYHLTRALLPLESSLCTANQPALKSNAISRLRVQAIVNPELQVPGVLGRALVREDRTSEPVELQIPEALPMVLSTEGWEQRS
jgi:hypothetical protein